MHFCTKKYSIRGALGGFDGSMVENLARSGARTEVAKIGKPRPVPGLTLVSNFLINISI